jgi:putative tricarboxylic transport membrane protein
MTLHGLLLSGDVLIGGALTAVGAYVLATGLGMPMGSASLPGPGVLPSAVGALLLLTGLLIAVLSWRRAQRAQSSETRSAGSMAWNVLIAVGALFFGAAFFKTLGAPAVLAIMLAVLFKAFARTSWWRAVLSGAAGAALAWLFFVRLLEVQLPVGFGM